MARSDYSVKDAAALLDRAAEVVDSAARQSTQGEWEARGQAVYAPHWDPRRGGECVVLLAQGGGDPWADAQWARLLNPQRGPDLSALLASLAEQVRQTSDARSASVLFALSLAEGLLRAYAT